jgi:hypothetical protein
VCAGSTDDGVWSTRCAGARAARMAAGWCGPRTGIIWATGSDGRRQQAYELAADPRSTLVDIAPTSPGVEAAVQAVVAAAGRLDGDTLSEDTRRVIGALHDLTVLLNAAAAPPALPPALAAIRDSIAPVAAVLIPFIRRAITQVSRVLRVIACDGIVTGCGSCVHAGKRRHGSPCGSRL